jgi:hypothetical protein
MPWPFCGEIDIMENINGQEVGHGTLHFENRPGISAETRIPDSDWHTWRLEIDRRLNAFNQESIVWFLDDSEFHRIHGSDIGNVEAWERLAHSPLFLILNMAVGGTWVGSQRKIFCTCANVYSSLEIRMKTLGMDMVQWLNTVTLLITRADRCATVTSNSRDGTCREILFNHLPRVLESPYIVLDGKGSRWRASRPNVKWLRQKSCRSEMVKQHLDIIQHLIEVQAQYA